MGLRHNLQRWFKRIRGFGYIESDAESVDSLVHYVEQVSENSRTGNSRGAHKHNQSTRTAARR